MQVKDAMTRDCEVVSADSSVREAAQRMRDKDIGMVLVRDEKGEYCGILTDRDIAIRAVADGKQADAPVQQFMTRDVERCYEDSQLEQAAQIMEDKQIRRLLICNRQDEPVGVLATADVARALGRSLTGAMLKEISQPSGQQSARH